jgi:hypothetical protein
MRVDPSDSSPKARAGPGIDIAVAILHPGLVRTRMVGIHPRATEPEVAVRGQLARIAGLTLANSGAFWQANGEVLPW